MKNKFLIVVCVCLLVAVLSQPAAAWLRPLYEDAIVVDRSELIVIGHLKEGSIEYVPHNKKPNEGASWEHHARLVITDVLKGSTNETEIPIIIHYGLTPVVGGYVKRDNFMLNHRGSSSDYPTNIVEVFDTGNSCVGGPPLVPDARDDNIWFLRKRSGIYGREEGTGDFGIVDPEDLRPVELKEYFMAYLSATPEPAIRRYQWVMADTQRLAQRYFDHLAVQRVLEITNTTKRLESIKHFYLKRQSWNMKQEAREAIIACGDVAAPLLMKMFDDPLLSEHRGDVILLLREINCRDAAPRLVELLELHNKFWRSVPLIDGRWNHGETPEDQKTRSRIYTEVYYGAYALGKLGDARATPVIRATKRQWLKKGFESDQIVEECDRFLRKLDEKKENGDRTTTESTPTK